MALNKQRMSPEIMQPEHYRPPEAELFNVGAMSDDQIVAVYRGLITAFDTQDSQGLDKRQQGGEVHDVHNVTAGLLDQLEASVSALTTADPERVKGLVSDCLQSEIEADHELALGVVSSLVHYDYAFTRDSLIFMQSQRHIASQITEGAFLMVPRLMRDHLSSDQIADFNATLEGHGLPSRQPARPES